MAVQHARQSFRDQDPDVTDEGLAALVAGSLPQQAPDVSAGLSNFYSYGAVRLHRGSGEDCFVFRVIEHKGLVATSWNLQPTSKGLMLVSVARSIIAKLLGVKRHLVCDRSVCV